MYDQKIRDDTARQFKKIRKLLKSFGYLKPKQKPLTEAEKVKLEGRY